MSTISSNQETITGVLSVEDILNPTRSGSYSDDYELVNFTVGEEVTLSLSSLDFDTYLQLIDGDTGEVIEENDNIGSGLNSRLSFIPVDNTNYIVRVTSYDESATGNYTLSSGIPDIDLQITNVTAPTSAVLGQTIEVEWTVTNQGSEDFFNLFWFDEIYLSTDTNLDFANDISLSLGSHGGFLAGGGSSTQSESIILDNYRIDLTQDWYLLFGTDVYDEQLETDETNNTYAVPIEFSAPNLVVTDYDAPNLASIGENIELSWTVENQGDVTAFADWDDYVYLSTDNIYDNTDVILDVQWAGSNTPLTAGDSYTLTSNVNLPIDQQGERYLIFVADRNNWQGETDETDNFLAVPINIDDNGPNLQVTNGTAPSTAFVGETVELSWTVANQGGVAASTDWYDGVYISDDDTFDNTDTFVTDQWIGSQIPLEAGDSYTLTETVTIPETAIGSRYLLFVTDEYNYQSETNETDNVYALPIELDALDVDLVVSNITTPIEAFSGQEVEITWSVTNQGNEDVTGTWEDHLYLSDDNTVGGDRFWDSLFFTGTISPGESVERTRTISLPVGEKGDYYLVVQTDGSNDIFELNNEDNNTTISTQPLSITIPSSPNLQVTNVTAPDTAFSTHEALIEWTVSNTGEGATNSSTWYDRVWLSSDQSLDNTDVFLGETTNENVLDVGGSYNNSLNVSLPQGTQGNYYFLVETDYYNHVSESDNEDDNLGVSNLSEITRDVPGKLEFSASQFTLNEDGTPVVAVSVNRLEGNGGEVSATLSLSNGTATAADYDNTDITVTFQDGETSQTVAIPLTDDTTFEATETVNLSLSNPTGGATLGERTTSVLNIIDNDAVSGTLAFSAANYTLNEDGTPVAEVTIVRSDGSDGAVTATVSFSDDTATAGSDYVAASQVVNFEDGETSKTVTIPLIDDSLEESAETLNLTLNNPTGGAIIGNQATAVVTITDNDFKPTLTVAIAAPQITEGSNTVQATVTRNTDTTEALSVTLFSGDATQLTVPNQVTIPAGETSFTFELNAVDDNLLEIPQNLSIIASAPGFVSSTDEIQILDNDQVNLSLSLDQNSIREDGGNGAVNGTVTRDVVTNQALVVELTSSDTSEINIPSQVIIAANQASTSFTLDVVDDEEIDDTQDVTITARPTEAINNTPVDLGIATANIQVTDNESPSLNITIDKGMIAESAGVDAATGTVTRNLVTNEELTVNLTSSDTSEATVPTTVVIGANQASATFSIDTVSDGVSDGIQTVEFTADASGFNSGTATVDVSDISVPDLVITNLEADNPLYTGTQTQFTYKVENQGLTSITGGITDQVYLSSDNQLDDGDTLLSDSNLEVEMPVGGFYERNISFFAPRTPGEYYLIATTDADNAINEGNGTGESNNTVVNPFTVTPAYQATVSTDTEVGIAGNAVILEGKAVSNIDNSPVPYEFVTVAVNHNGTVRELDAFTDGEGNFVREFQALPGEGGDYQINAFFPDNPHEDAIAEDNFTLLGMRFNTDEVSHQVLADSTFNAQVELENLTDTSLTGITYEVEGAPSNWDIQVNAPTTLAGDGTNAISYTINAPNESLIIRDSFDINLTSTEGVTASLPVTVDLERIVPRLVADAGKITSGMLRGEQTIIEFELTNEGGAATGDIQLQLPEASWLSSASGTTIESLAPGESTNVSLLLSPEADLPLTVYEGNLFFDGEGNDGDLSLPFEFRAVSEATGDLQVSVVDDYTFYVEGAPKVSDAKVSLIDPYNQNVVVEVQTDENGIAFFDDIQEGFYQLKVGADNHQNYLSSYTITPGSFSEQEVFLPLQNVSYEWSVTPTAIQDEYDITVNSVFETDVPVPVLTITPETNDLSQLSQFPGEVNQIDFTVTNHGLIAADNVELFFPNHLFWDFKPLVTDIGILPAKSSLTIPVIVTNRGFQSSDTSSVIDVEFTELEDNDISSNDNNIGSEIEEINLTTDFDSYPSLVKLSENSQIVTSTASSSSSDEGNYYNPNNKPASLNPSTWKGITPPDWTPQETINAEFGNNLFYFPNFSTTFLTNVERFFGSQTKDIWERYLNSGPSDPASKQFYKDGDQIVEGYTLAAGFKDAAVTEDYVDRIWSIAQKEIFKELIKDFQDCKLTPKKWDIATLLPSYYVKPNHNKDGSDRDGYKVPGLPSNPAHLDYTPDYFNLDSVSSFFNNFGVSIPELIAGGVGHGGTVAFASTTDKNTGVLQPGSPENLWLDSREITGHIELVKTGSCTYELRPTDDLQIIINDTVDFLPGNIEGPFTETLSNLEANGGAFDVPFNVTFTPNIEPIEFSTCCDLTAGVNWSYPCGPYDNSQSAFVEFRNASDCCPPIKNIPSYVPSASAPLGVSIIPTPPPIVTTINCSPSLSSSALNSGAKIHPSNADSVCARVKLQIDQSAVMTRSAFLGELTIENGLSFNLENISVNLEIEDEEGNIVSDLFGINNPIINNITSVDGTGILTGDNPNTIEDEGIGSAEWKFIPTNLAALEEPTTYNIKGTLSYTESGQLITVPLISTPITVLPQAELHLDYFHQRDVFADDPFTDPIETSVPYSLGVLVRNEGKGTASNLQIESAQPKIVDNEKGLLIDFEILGTQVGTESVTPSLTVDFGDIAPGETAVADWLLKSSLQGKFIEYEATFEHVNDLGNPELSLIKEVNIHELIRKVQVDHPTDDGLADFLVNDEFDANFHPDTLYFSDGATATVNTVTDATPDSTATIFDLEIDLSANTDQGWNYILLQDPADGQFQIEGVLRSDGTQLSLDNVWRTDRTFPATGRPIYEDKLHILDYNATAGTSDYTIIYSTGDDTGPQVQDIVDVDPNPRNIPVNTLDVVFTEAIRSETFDYNDITLTLDDGDNLITNSITVREIDPTTYRIRNLTGITGNIGQYQLSIDATGIEDLGGIAGSGIVNENWLFTGERPSVAEVTGFSGNLVNTPVDTVEVTFTEAINPSSFGIDDISLTRNDGGNLINNSVTISQINETTYSLENLAGLTNIDGDYEFLVQANGVTDTDGNSGVGGEGFNWTLDTGALTITDLTDVTSPRNTPISSLDVTFSKAINPDTLDLNDLFLSTDGSTNLITDALTIEELSTTTYRFSGLTSLQDADGDYLFAIQGEGITDLAGNSASNSLQQTWTLDTTAPETASNLEISASQLQTSSTSFTTASNSELTVVNSTSLTIQGELSEEGLLILLEDATLDEKLAQAEVTGTSFSGEVQLAAPGSRTLRIKVLDAAGNTTSQELDIFADVTKPVVLEILNVPNTSITTPVNHLDIRFSETIDLATFDYQDLTLRRDGGDNLITDGVTIEHLSGTTYRINGLTNLTDTPGNYQLVVNTNAIADLAGNNGDTTSQASFSIIAEPEPGILISQSLGSTEVSEGGLADSYTIVLQTQPSEDVTITINSDDQITTNLETITFTSENWNTPRTVTVTAVDDGVTEGLQTSTISHSITTGDTDYQNLNLADISVSVEDNDGEIKGTVWNDENGDGIEGATEPGLANWTVYLDANQNGQLDEGETSTQTDGDGNYHFSALAPDTYTVSQVVPEGWEQTYPGVDVSTTASSTRIFTPSTPETFTSINFSTASQLINIDDFRTDTRFTNIDGTGFASVIIDTGIDLDHPFFGADSDGNGIADRIVYQYDFGDNDANANDVDGHGSHVASIIGSSSNAYPGVAPNADIIALKVFQDNGSGFFSDLEASLQWVIDNASTYNIASVNLSLGDEQNWNTATSRYGIGDELAALAGQGIIVTSAAGNNFADFNSFQGLAYPAADPNTIAVGAVWSDTDQIADFSQRHGDLSDIFAPGIPITAANAQGETTTLGGTSQAAPYIAGIAVLAQQIATENLGRKLTVAEFRHLLETTSITINDGDDETDDVINTGLDFSRVDMQALAEGILNLSGETPEQEVVTPDDNAEDTPLYLPADSLPLAQTVNLSSGEVVEDVNFGNLECFLTGTRILTDKGEVAVENLQIGDNVVTAEGKLEPIKWIGYQTVKPHQVKQPLRGYPILIKAGALGNNLPHRDLYVSPDHGMYFEEVLINAGALVNGTSVIKTEPKSAFTYYHVELENHVLLLAEGAQAESYLPQNEDRLAYENGAEYEELYPYGSNLMLWPMDYPRISSWVKVPRYMRKKLNLIAQQLGLEIKAG